MTERLWFTENGADLAEGIELRNQKSKPGGWSSAEVWLVREVGAFVPDEVHIADLYCGEVINIAEGYGFRKEKVE